MRVSKNAMLWFVLIGAFFYPSGIIGTSLSKVWYYWQLSSIVLGAIYIFFKIKIVKHIEKSTWFIVLFYVFQILATSINGLAITYDLKSFFAEYLCGLPGFCNCVVFCVGFLCYLGGFHKNDRKQL